MQMEVCSTMVECCSEEKKYCYYYAILARHLCMTDEVYKEYFERCFVQQYSMSDRLEGKKLRNVVTFFAHLLATDTLSLRVLSNIRLTEEETTPASLIFIKLLFQVSEFTTLLLHFSHFCFVVWEIDLHYLI